MARRRIRANERNEIIKRANGLCEYCKSRADHATEIFAVEHIVPVSRGGATALDNLAFACSGCNSYKHTRVEALDPVTEQIVSLFIRAISSGQSILRGAATPRASSA